MNEAAALLAAIYANPDEDTPRLVYADWLDEHDQPERAEFIRVQIELARTDDSDDSGKLHKREHKLLETNFSRWTASLGKFNRKKCNVSFARGFPDYLTLRNCKDADLQIISRVPNLRCLDIHASTLTPIIVREIAALKSLEYLNISDTPFELDWYKLLEALPCWTKIRIPPSGDEENLFHYPSLCHEARIAKLSRLASDERRKAALRYLRYSESGVTSPTQSVVKCVRLNQDSVCDAELRLLTAVPEIEEFYNSDGNITTDGLAHLARLPNLKLLELYFVPVTSLAPLARCKKLEKLCFSPQFGVMVDDEITKGLERLTNLRSLTLRGDYYGEDTIRRIASLRKLRSLDIDIAYTHDEPFVPLLKLRELESLTLSSIKFTGVKLKKFLKGLR